VTSGRYNLSANVPDGYYIKAARSGDLDVLASGLEVGSDPIPPLDVVLSHNPGLITGVVQNPDTRQPAPFSMVTLVPQEEERRDQEWYYKTATADGSGAFTFKNVAPGEYRIYAWDEIEDGAYMDPDFLKPYQAKSESISVKEADRLTQPVTLISAGPSAVAATVYSQ
jgi:Polysaccharide lyase family 4, domain II